MRAGERVRLRRGFRLRFWRGRRDGRCGLGASALQLELDAIDFGQHRGQFLLQILFGALIIVIGEFADAIFELQVAQIFVNRGLALVQVGERGDRFRSGRSLGRTPRINAMTTIAITQTMSIITRTFGRQSRSAISFSIWSLYFARAGSSNLDRSDFGHGFGLAIFLERTARSPSAQTRPRRTARSIQKRWEEPGKSRRRNPV